MSFKQLHKNITITNISNCRKLYNSVSYSVSYDTTPYQLRLYNSTSYVCYYSNEITACTYYANMLRIADTPTFKLLNTFEQ